MALLFVLLATLPFSLLLAYRVAELVLAIQARSVRLSVRARLKAPVLTASFVVLLTEPLLLYIGLGLIRRLGLK